MPVPVRDPLASRRRLQTASALLSLLLAAAALSACRGAPPADSDSGIPTLHRLTQRDRIYDVAWVGDEAWIVGFPGLILHSPDRGETWESLPGGGRSALFAVDFAGPSNGWIVGREGLVLRTTDGGRTWTETRAGTKEPLFDVDFVDRSMGWAVGNFGVILHSADGGESWTRQRVVEDEEGEATGETSAEEEAGEFDRVLSGVFFLDASTGWIAGESGTILHTTDGGRRWVPQDSGEWAPLHGLLFLDARAGFAAGSEGALLVTSDGGETWERVETPTGDHLFSLAVSGDRLLAAGRRGVLLAAGIRREGEGGDLSLGPVEKVPLGVYQWLSGLGFGPSGRGLLAGGQGLVMRTRDHGVTWQRVSR